MEHCGSGTLQQSNKFKIACPWMKLQEIELLCLVFLFRNSILRNKAFVLFYLFSCAYNLSMAAWRQYWSFNELMVVFLGFHNNNSISNCFTELEELAALTGSRYGRYIYEQEVDMH